MEKWTTVLISCVIMYVTRGGGAKKSENFMDVIDGCPLKLPTPGVNSNMKSILLTDKDKKIAS